MNNNKTLFLFLLLVLLGVHARAADVSISPVRLAFSSDKNTDVLYVRNRSQDAIRMQLSVYAWAQDDLGKDVLTPTTEIVAFPKILEIAGGEERIIRVGSRAQGAGQEKTYRLYLEELPNETPVRTQVSLIRTLTKVGIPVFLSPVQEMPQDAAMSSLTLTGAGLGVMVENPGNVHDVIQSVQVTGLDGNGNAIHVREVAGWYLLAGSRKSYNIEIAREDCLKLSDIDVLVTTNRSSSRERVHVSQQMCSP